MRAVAILVVMVVSMTTAGCASLWNPRVSYPGALEEGPSTAKTCVEADWKSVKGSLKCATVARIDLDRRASDQAMLPRVIGSILIPLTAAIAGLAMTGTTGVPITALTLAGVATMGEGVLLSNPQRRQAYSIAASAVQCVISNTHPLVLRDDAPYDKFRQHVEALPGLRSNVVVAIDDLKRQLAATPPADPTTQRHIEEEIANAELAVAAANDLITKGGDALTLLDRAAGDIRASVERIISFVNEEVDKLEPTMESVRQAVLEQNQLRASAFAGLDALVAESQRRADAAAAREEDRKKKRENAKREGRTAEAAVSLLEQKRMALQAAVRELNSTMAAVSVVLRRLGPAQAPLPCVTKAESALGAGVLTITRSTDEPVSPGQTVVFLVSGGVGDVSIVTNEAGQAAFDIAHKMVGGVRQVVVKVKTTAKLGTYRIDVVDKFRKDYVEIVVVAPPPGPLKLLEGSNALQVETGSPVIFKVGGGNGTAPCSATFEPEKGFVKPETSVDDAVCTIKTGWALAPPTDKQIYKLKVTFGGSTHSFDVAVTKKP